MNQLITIHDLRLTERNTGCLTIVAVPGTHPRHTDHNPVTIPTGIITSHTFTGIGSTGSIRTFRWIADRNNFDCTE